MTSKSRFTFTPNYRRGRIHRRAVRAIAACMVLAFTLGGCGDEAPKTNSGPAQPDQSATSSAPGQGGRTATSTVYLDPSPDNVAAYIAAQAPRPYLGWSSWSLQSTKAAGLNPKGNYSWLTAAHVLEQGAALAATLKPHGYEYVNIDAGWWRTWDWTPEYDQYGRPAVDIQRFPDGLAPVVKTLHDQGLKVGIYMPVGLEKGAYDNGDFPILGAPGCTTHGIVFPDLRTTNGWDSSYAMDFSTPCAQYYLDSISAQFAEWGFDLLKLDGVGPGSGKTGSSYDNTTDVQAWATALAGSGRTIQLEISWALDRGHLDSWQRWSNGRRVESDVECYCSTLVQWNRSVRQRFTDVTAWTSDAGPGSWNNLDSLDVGNGEMDGLTDAERQTYMTLWAIESSPLYSGDDLTQLDDYGRSLLTNDEVIAIDQAGVPAAAVNTATPQQVWTARMPDNATTVPGGATVVALFNLAEQPATVSAVLADLGISQGATVRDVWAHAAVEPAEDTLTRDLPAHGSALFIVQR